MCLVDGAWAASLAHSVLRAGRCAPPEFRRCRSALPRGAGSSSGGATDRQVSECVPRRRASGGAVGPSLDGAGVPTCCWRRRRRGGVRTMLMDMSRYAKLKRSASFSFNSVLEAFISLPPHLPAPWEYSFGNFLIFDSQDLPRLPPLLLQVWRRAASSRFTHPLLLPPCAHATAHTRPPYPKHTPPAPRPPSAVGDAAAVGCGRVIVWTGMRAPPVSLRR